MTKWIYLLEKILLCLIITLQVPFIYYMYTLNSMQFTLSIVFCLSLIVLLSSLFLTQFSLKIVILVRIIKKLVLTLVLMIYSCFLLIFKSQLAYLSFSSLVPCGKLSCSCSSCPEQYSGIMYSFSLVLFLNFSVRFI